MLAWTSAGFRELTDMEYYIVLWLHFLLRDGGMDGMGW